MKSAIKRFYDVERLLVKYGYFTATGTAMRAVTALEGSFMLKMKRKTLFLYFISSDSFAYPIKY